MLDANIVLEFRQTVSRSFFLGAIGGADQVCWFPQAARDIKVQRGLV